MIQFETQMIKQMYHKARIASRMRMRVILAPYFCVEDYLPLRDNS